MRQFAFWRRAVYAATTQAVRIRRPGTATLIPVLVLVGLPASVTAQGSVQQFAASPDTIELTLAEAQRLARNQNPTLLAERLATGVARGELRQARAFAPNPELEFQPDVEFDRQPGLRARGTVSHYELGLTQEIEWAGQRGLRIRAAEHELDRARQTVSDAERTTHAEVTGAYYEAYAARRQLDVTRDLLQSNERLLEAVHAQLLEGGLSGLEVSLAEIEVGRARGRLLASMRESQAADIALKRLAGLTPEQPIQLSDQLPSVPEPESVSRESLLQLALERRPDLAAREAAVREAEALRALAGRETIPNVRISALAARSTDGGKPWFGVAFALPVPLWNWNRGEVAARAAVVDRAGLERQATELAVRAQVEEAYGAYLSAAEEERVYQTTVLQPAGETQQRLEIAFRAGKLNLSAVLLLRNQLLEAETGYWEAWLARRQALARLEGATAGSLSNN